MVSYLYGHPSGVIGDVSRVDESNVEPAFLVAPFPAGYGLAMISSGANITPYAGGAVAAIQGILARAAPGISQSSAGEAINVFQPNQTEVQGLMVRGYMNVHVNTLLGVPVKGAQVFIVATASAGHVVGEFETTANGGNNIALTGTLVGNVTFASNAVDSLGIGEIRVAQ